MALKYKTQKQFTKILKFFIKITTIKKKSKKLKNGKIMTKIKK